MVGPNVGITPQDGALLISMLDRIERRMDNIEGRLDHMQSGIAANQLEHAKLEARGNTDRLKMLILVATIGGAGGSILPKIIEMFGVK
jgi:hypothetical protein